MDNINTGHVVNLRCKGKNIFWEGPGAFERALKESAKNGEYPEDNWNLKFIEDNINVKNLKVSDQMMIT